MRAAGQAVVVPLALLMLGGCTQTVAGQARRGAAPDPVAAESVGQIFLDDAELSKVLRTGFEADARRPARSGGIEQLSDSWEAGVPRDCVGVAESAQRSAYQQLTVHHVDWKDWRYAGLDRSAMNEVTMAVVALPSAADAQAAFEVFAGQWGRCEGVAVTRDTPGNAAATISDVRAGSQVVTATVNTKMSRILGMWTLRALGVQGSCLVDVDVFFGANDEPASDSAADTARAEMAKIGRSRASVC
jgi:hypothetical protein